MRIAVCDDHASDLERISYYVSRFVAENLLEAEIECFSKAEQMLLKYRKNPYDLLLLDIYMNGQSGVEAAEALRKAGSGCEIIFITNSLDHALDGYRLKAMEYLVKPVSWDEAEQALRRCCSRFADSSRYIEIKCGKEIKRLRLCSILWVEVFGHQSVFHTSSGELTTRTSLDEIEAMLGGLPFFRSSRSYLINFKEADHLEQDGFHMTDGSFIPIPVRHADRKAVQRAYQNYLFDSSGKERLMMK